MMRVLAPAVAPDKSEVLRDDASLRQCTLRQRRAGENSLLYHCEYNIATADSKIA
jgi:hypothetical protein